MRLCHGGKGGGDFLAGAHAAQRHPRGERVELQEDEREVAPQLARPEPHAPRPDVGEDAGAAVVALPLQRGVCLLYTSPSPRDS